MAGIGLKAWATPPPAVLSHRLSRDVLTRAEVPGLILQDFHKPVPTCSWAQ